jgi:hypothetical protein
MCVCVGSCIYRLVRACQTVESHPSLNARKGPTNPIYQHSSSSSISPLFCLFVWLAGWLAGWLVGWLVLTHLRREEADEVVEQVDAQAVCHDEPSVEKEDAQGVEGHEPREDEPAQARVHCRPVQDVLPFPVG